MADTVGELDDTTVRRTDPRGNEWQPRGRQNPLERVGSGAPRRRIPWVWLAIVVIVVVEGFIIAANHGPSVRAGEKTPRSAVQGPARSTASPQSAALTSSAFGRTDTSGPALLGVTARWELFGRGPVDVVRVQLARGRVTRTSLPALASGGPVSFLVARGGVFVRPLDRVPGYFVPDTAASRPLHGTLATSGPALPGPDPSHVWSPARGASPPALALTSILDGAQGKSLPVPNGGSLAGSRPDGSGGVLFTATGGVYDGRLGTLRRVTSGSVIAVGPTLWLAEECDGRAVCSLVVIDRNTGGRRVLGSSLASWMTGGTISPDGRSAALIGLGVGRSADLVLVDLSGGTQRTAAVSVAPASGEGSVVWSPDGSWLFAVTSAGQVAAVDPRTAVAVALGVTLPPLSQLAIRPAS